VPIIISQLLLDRGNAESIVENLIRRFLKGFHVLSSLVYRIFAFFVLLRHFDWENVNFLWIVKLFDENPFGITNTKFESSLFFPHKSISNFIFFLFALFCVSI
jgi:hypothetical protein